jgi:hypothetical protein
MKFKLIVSCLAILATGLALANAPSKQFIVTYQNNTNHEYRYFNNLPLDPSQYGFGYLGDWKNDGTIISGQKVIFSGISSNNLGTDRWVKFMLKNKNDSVGMEFEFLNPAFSSPILFNVTTKEKWTKFPRSGRFYLITIELQTVSGKDIAIVQGSESCTYLESNRECYATGFMPEYLDVLNQH